MPGYGFESKQDKAEAARKALKQAAKDKRKAARKAKRGK